MLDVSVATEQSRAATPPLRVARGTVVAVVGLLLATTSHALAGGAASPGPLGLPVALLVVAGCVVASSRAWTPGRLVVVLVAIQVVSHLTMLLGTPSAQVDPRLAGLAASGALHEHGHTATLTPTMLVGHAVAVALAAAVLARVDVAVTVLWHLAGRLLVALPAAAVPLPSLVRVPVDSYLRRVRAVLLPSSTSRRGPPVLLARA